MFSQDFRPTSGRVAAKMLSKISKDAVHFLDPSAGKGDLAKAILGFGRNARDFGHYGSNRSRHRVDVIESDPDLIHILRANEDLNFVGMDWLTYSGVSYYDAIVMNPPFSNGAAHLIHAWEFLHARRNRMPSEPGDHRQSVHRRTAATREDHRAARFSRSIGTVLPRQRAPYRRSRCPRVSQKDC
jgi:hypothetical protein